MRKLIVLADERAKTGCGDRRKTDLRRGPIVSVGVDLGIAVGAQVTYCTVTPWLKEGLNVFTSPADLLGSVQNSRLACPHLVCNPNTEAQPPKSKINS